MIVHAIGALTLVALATVREPRVYPAQDFTRSTTAGIVSVDSDPLSIVLTTRPLPKGAIAAVEIRPRGLQRTFIIVFEGRVKDALIMRAHGRALAYSHRHPEDTGHVQLMLYPDGRLETQSDSRGLEVGSHVPLAGRVSNTDDFTKELLEHASTIAQTDFPGFGPARVVDWIAAKN